MRYNLKMLMASITIFCVLLGLWVACPRDKFHYRQEVKVIGGFYQGQHGTISSDKWFWRYSVKMDKGNWDRGKIETISQFNLEPAFVETKNAE